MDNESKEMFQKILDRLDKMDARFEKMDSRLGKLESGQAEIRRELYKIDRKIADTYNLALDAWGQGAENKEWLEDKKRMA